MRGLALARSADIPVRSDLRTSARTGSRRTFSKARCCGQECPRSAKRAPCPFDVWLLVLGACLELGCWCLELLRGRISPNFKSLWLELGAWCFSGCWMLVLGASWSAFSHH